MTIEEILEVLELEPDTDTPVTLARDEMSELCLLDLPYWEMEE